MKPNNSTYRNYLPFVISGLLFSFLFNIINFPSQFFMDFAHFTVFSLVYLAEYVVIYFFFTGLTNLFLKTFPGEKNMYKRITLTILSFVLFGGLLINATLQFYGSNPWFSYTYRETVFLWNFIVMAILNIFFTVLFEGIRNYREWKKSITETEKLDFIYSQSRLNALKSQVNPHFLFNSLNTLSSLIEEDEEKAEDFLNEMTKVYRYMLRKDDEPMVTLETELKFIRSYLHLLETRFNEGLQVGMNVSPSDMNKWIAPHSLQAIIENAFSHHVISKKTPLKIWIESAEIQRLKVVHNIQFKQIVEEMDFDDGLDNLVAKYKAMGLPLEVEEAQTSENMVKSRVITIPLVDKMTIEK